MCSILHSPDMSRWGSTHNVFHGGGSTWGEDSLGGWSPDAVHGRQNDGRELKRSTRRAVYGEYGEPVNHMVNMVNMLNTVNMVINIYKPHVSYTVIHCYTIKLAKHLCRVINRSTSCRGDGPKHSKLFLGVAPKWLNDFNAFHAFLATSVYGWNWWAVQNVVCWCEDSEWSVARSEVKGQEWQSSDSWVDDNDITRLQLWGIPRWCRCPELRREIRPVLSKKPRHQRPPGRASKLCRRNLSKSGFLLLADWLQDQEKSWILFLGSCWVHFVSVRYAQISD